MKYQDFEYKEPETYEDAVQVLKQKTHDSITRGAIRAVWIRAGILTAIGAAAAVICGITGSPAYLVITIAGFSLLVGGITLLPIIGIKLDAHNVNSGKAFEKVSEEEVIKSAKAWVRIHNDHMAKKKRKKKK